MVITLLLYIFWFLLIYHHSFLKLLGLLNWLPCMKICFLPFSLLNLVRVPIYFFVFGSSKSPAICWELKLFFTCLKWEQIMLMVLIIWVLLLDVYFASFSKDKVENEIDIELGTSTALGSDSSMSTFERFTVSPLPHSPIRMKMFLWQYHC